MRKRVGSRKEGMEGGSQSKFSLSKASNVNEILIKN